MKLAWKRNFVRDLTAIVQQHNTALQKVPERAVRRGAFELLAVVQARWPKRTGTGVRSTGAEVRVKAGGEVDGIVGSHMKYARYLEEGTGEYGPKKTPIIVQARKAKALFWGAFGEGGEPIITKRVLIRGVKPIRMFSGGLEAYAPRYLAVVRQEVERVE